MTVDEVKEEIERICAMASDPEGAHIAEDTLWQDVLQAIAKGADDPAGLALAALATEDIEFARWYA